MIDFAYKGGGGPQLGSFKYRKLFFFLFESLRIKITNSKKINKKTVFIDVALLLTNLVISRVETSEILDELGIVVFVRHYD